VWGKAANIVRDNTPDQERLIREMELRATLARALRQDNTGAQARLRTAVDEARKLDGNPDNNMPCYYDQVLQIASGLAMASNNCAEGAALRVLADRMKAQCTRSICESEGDKLSCDAPKGLKFHSTNACRRAFAIENNR
jgi:hypothetical protein